MKLFYNTLQEAEESNDIQRKMAIGQGYVPSTCLLSGIIIMSEMNRGNDPCSGCNEDRIKCKGRPKSERLGV